MSLKLIRPFRALRPRADRASQVAAPPYDVLTSLEARQRGTGNPFSFLHVSKSEIDLDPGISFDDPIVYAKAAKNFQKMRSEGTLIREKKPALYLYRLVQGEHQQTGLVSAVSVEAYLSGRIKRHEFTRPDKENDRTRHAEALQAHSGPVFLLYRNTPDISDLLKSVAQQRPLYDVTVVEEGVRHLLWAITEDDQIQQMVETFEQRDALYVADGHHRSAAAARLFKTWCQAHPDDQNRNGCDDTDGSAGGSNLVETPCGRFLAILFPDDQVRVLDYNRVVRDLNGLTPAEFLEQVAERFELTPSDHPVRPTCPGSFGLFLDHRWYRLALRHPPHSDDPVERLDVRLLARYILEPILDITDPRRDSRIDFVGGARGLEGLTRRVESGEMVAAFSLYPTTVANLMAVADAGRVMPPKSTWFEPKPRDGLIIQLFDNE